jgi:hypothetical protein
LREVQTVYAVGGKADRNSGLEWIRVGADAPGLRNDNVVEGLMLVAEACQPDSKDHGGGCGVSGGNR